MNRYSETERRDCEGAPRIALATIILLGLALRLFRLGADSIWYDEGVSLYLASLSLPDLIAHTAGDIHPPLYYALLHAWSAVAGRSEFAAAFFSLFFGMLLIAATFALARRLLGSEVAPLAALLVAFSPYHLWYSQEIRMYTLGALLGVLSFWFLVKAITPGPSSGIGGGGMALTSGPPREVGEAETAPAPSPSPNSGGGEERAASRSAGTGGGEERAASRSAGTGGGEAHAAVSPFSSPRIGGGEGSRGVEVRAWLGYVVCAALGLYTLYYFAFLLLFEALAVVGLWLAARSGRGVGYDTRPTGDAARGAGYDARPAADLRVWLAAQAAVLVLYLPWLPVALRQVTQPPVPPWRSSTGLATVFVESWSALSLGQSATAGAAALLLMVGLIYAIGVLWTDGRLPTLLLVGYTFVPLLVIYLVSLWTPLYHVRYVFLFAPAFSIVLARGLALIRRPAAVAGALALVVIVLAGARSAQAYFYDAAYAPDDHRAAVRFVAERALPGDAVLINAGYAYPTFLYYYKGEIAWRGRLLDYPRHGTPGRPGLVILQTGSIDGSPSLGWGSPAADFYATTEAETAAALDEVGRRHSRLWVVRIYDTVTDPQAFIRRYLDERFLMIDDAGLAGSSSMRVQLYRTYRTARTAAPSTARPMQANLGSQMRLAAYELPATLYPGEPAYLTLYWQAANVAEDLRAFVSLVDATGREWAHWDDAPGGRLNPTSRWAAGEVVAQGWRLTVPPGTPPGQYRLAAGLYRAGSGARLDVLDAAGRSTGTTVRLDNVQVERARVAVDTERLPVQRRLSANLGGEARLLGYSVGSRLAKPGESVDLTVFWQGITAATGDRVVFVQLVDSNGKLWAAAEGPPAAAWNAGEVLYDRYRLPVPADAPDGEMRLIIGMYRADNKQRLALQSGVWPQRGDSVDLGMVRIAGREHVYSAPAVQRPLQARLGELTDLLGYDLSPDRQPLLLAPAAQVRLTLYWQAMAASDVSYTVFVQLLDADNRVAGQDDAAPGGGLAPTTSWVKGEIVADLHEFALRADAAPGDYRLVAGLYDAASGARLAVFVNNVRQPGDMIVLETVTVR